MPDTVDKVAERLARLEGTVAQGFHENTIRFENLEARIEKLDARVDTGFRASESRDEALGRKIDANAESLRAEINKAMQTTIETLREEFRRGRT